MGGGGEGKRRQFECKQISHSVHSKHLRSTPSSELSCLLVLGYYVFLYLLCIIDWMHIALDFFRHGLHGTGEL